MCSYDVITGPASRRLSPPRLLPFHPLFSMNRLFLPTVSSFFYSVIISFPLGPLLFLLELSFLHKSASYHQSNRNAGSWCVLMEAQSQPLLLPKSHSSTFSYTINSISGERAFMNVCFLSVPRQCSPPKQPWASCSNSPVFEKGPQLSARFPEPSWDRV